MKKTIYFDMDDMVGNLFITLKEAGLEVSKVTYHMVNIYSNLIMVGLYDKGIASEFKLSRNDTQEFLFRNQGLYADIDGKELALVKDMTVDELIEKYRGYLSLDALSVICDPRIIFQAVYTYELDERVKKMKRR